MDVGDTRPDLLGPDLSTPLLAALATGALALWAASHLVDARLRGIVARLVSFAVRAALGTACLWLAFQLLARFVYLSTGWSLVATAVIGALCIELTTEIYRHERRIVSRTRGRAMQSLRAGAIICVLLILLQPVWAKDLERQMQRELVILVDDSASMGLADKQLDTSERLEVAALFGVAAAARENTLADVQRSLGLLDKRLGVEIAALQPPDGVSKTAADALIAKRAPPLKAFLERSGRSAAALAEVVAKQQGKYAKLSRESQALLQDYDKRIRDNIANELGQAALEVSKGEYEGARARLHGASRQIRFVLAKLPAASAETDKLYFESLPAAARAEIDAAAGKTRAAIAREVLARAGDGGRTIVDALADDYQMRFLRFAEGAMEMDGKLWLESGDADAAADAFREAQEQAAREALEEMGADSEAETLPVPEPAPVEPISRRRTDFATALDSVLQKVPTHDLAGVMVLSDGRHNGERAAEEAARRMGLNGVPVCSVVVGSKLGPRDAAVLAVRVPESIFQDDRAVVQADLKLDGLRGEDVEVTLFEAGEPVASETVAVADQSYRTTVRFAHTPKKIGIFDYEIVVSPMRDEVFSDNNRWKFQIAVTDDRTNVLLVDSFPRWEFRYLRNLFYARDKSVHLQHVLLAPDQIEDAPPVPLVPASASRAFGDAEATALPVSREEWLKFDAIILGDLPPAALGEDDWEAIRYAVAERGALLITIAGPRFMPHAFEHPTFLEMLPAQFARSDGTMYRPPEEAFRLRLTSDGRQSLVMQQSMDPTINEMVWGGLPPLHWRHPVESVKEGAEVLAWAEPIKGALAPAAPASFEAQQLAERRNPLIVSQRYALGRSLLINFDQTWRLRYGVGDVYHHKFWGQIMRWGTGENLRAGTEFVRLGTDRLSYGTSDEVKVVAKILDEKHQPVDDSSVSVAIYERDQLVLRKQLDHREESNGIYEGTMQAPEEPGRYRIVLEGKEASRILATQNVTAVETEFIVNADKNAVELAELTADSGFLGQLAALSGGAVADPDNAGSLVPFFRDPGRVVRERREVTLWDNFALLIPFFLLLGMEWYLRRQGGLA